MRRYPPDELGAAGGRRPGRPGAPATAAHGRDKQTHAAPGKTGANVEALAFSIHLGKTARYATTAWLCIIAAFFATSYLLCAYSATSPLAVAIEAGLAAAIAAAIETSTSVRHDSYLFNMFYDFNFGTRWTPYVGAGIGFGRYQQETSFNYNADLTKFKQELGTNGSMEDLEAIIATMPDSVTGSVTPDQASHDLYRFEWQVSAGVAYNFDEDWVLDLGYRFNSATVGGEFVYAHEVKLGARYMF